VILASQGSLDYLALECLAERTIALALRHALARELGLKAKVAGEVRRFEVPNLHALQFVCERALDTGVTTSLGLDPHGKTLSYALLEMQMET